MIDSMTGFEIVQTEWCDRVHILPAHMYEMIFDEPAGEAYNHCQNR